jgi:predicted nucleic acid-binding protein
MKKATTEVTMREFRKAPAKALSLAARTKTRLLIGDFVIAVDTAKSRDDAAALHGCMRATGRVVGSPDELLSAHDHWSTDA